MDCLHYQRLEHSLKAMSSIDMMNYVATDHRQTGMQQQHFYSKYN